MYLKINNTQGHSDKHYIKCTHCSLIINICYLLLLASGHWTLASAYVNIKIYFCVLFSYTHNYETKNISTHHPFAKLKGAASRLLHSTHHC
jgi:hypothetical protein